MQQSFFLFFEFAKVFKMCILPDKVLNDKIIKGKISGYYGFVYRYCDCGIAFAGKFVVK